MDDARLCLFYKLDDTWLGCCTSPGLHTLLFSNRISRYCHSMIFRQVSTRDGVLILVLVLVLT